MNHNEILRHFETELALTCMKNDADLAKLRGDLVEKYGEDGVRKVEAKITENKSCISDK